MRGGCIPNLPALPLIGRIPTAAYPDSVQTTPQGQLIWVAGKGFGSGPNPTYYFGGAKTPYQTPPNAVRHLRARPADRPRRHAAASHRPSGRRRHRGGRRPVAARTTARASPPAARSPPRPGTRARRSSTSSTSCARTGPTTRSSARTRGATATPQLELFDDNGVSGPTGGITPNAHALARQFPLLDHFYEDSEVSVDGHLITAGAVRHRLRRRRRRRPTTPTGAAPYDFGIYPVTFPPKFFIFDQAAKQGVSFRDYGEAVGAIPTGAAPNRPEFAKVQANVDASYPNNVFIGCLQAGVTASCTQDSGLYNGTGTLFAGQSRFNVWYPQFESAGGGGHRPGVQLHDPAQRPHQRHHAPATPTPQAMIADNDLALGQIVDAISHSSIWPSTAIFVVEDDSQDGADHVDSHRSPAFVISPWARHGAVVHTRYDQYSMLRTVELILGLDPLALNDALATPMYDAFISGSAEARRRPVHRARAEVPARPAQRGDGRRRQALRRAAVEPARRRAAGDLRPDPVGLGARRRRPRRRRRARRLARRGRPRGDRAPDAAADPLGVPSRRRAAVGIAGKRELPDHLGLPAQPAGRRLTAQRGRATAC